MKYIKLNESYKATNGEDYTLSKYPCSGMFECSIGYIHVNKERNIYSIISSLPSIEEDAQNTSMSEDFILKALAVAQDPTLALSLIKGIK